MEPWVELFCHFGGRNHVTWMSRAISLSSVFFFFKSVTENDLLLTILSQNTTKETFHHALFRLSGLQKCNCFAPITRHLFWNLLMSELAPSNKKQVYKTWPRQIFFFRSTLPFALNVQSEAAFYLILSCCTLWLLSLPEGPQHRELNGESLLLGDCCAWVAVCNRSLLTPPPTAAEISCQMLSPCKQYCVIMLLITRNNHIRHSNKSATTLSRAAQPHSKNKNKK